MPTCSRGDRASRKLKTRRRDHGDGQADQKRTETSTTGQQECGMKNFYSLLSRLCLLLAAAIVLLSSASTAFTPSSSSAIYLTRRYPVPAIHSVTNRHMALSRPRQSRLQLLAPSGGAAAAAAALIISTVTGKLTDQWIAPNAGILATLTTAAVLSNTGMVPASHALYDVCWSTFLPASLALLLLSLEKTTKKQTKTGEVSSEHAVGRVVRDLALPFGLASLGSILGCLLAFMGRNIICLSAQDAALASACLVASLIGGSVNFFATAAALAGSSASSSGSASTSTLVSSMAAADLVLMALYFAFLDGALRSPQLQKWYANRRGHVVDEQQVETLLWKDVNTTHSLPTTSLEDAAPRLKDRPLSFVEQTPAILLVSSLALTIVQVAARVERTVSHIAPGTACAVIAAITPFIQRLLPSNKLTRDMKDIAAPLAEGCFLCLFAAIGMSANLGQALRSGPSCLLFSLTALMVHVITVFAGTLWVGGMRLEDVLVASNAAVGGPATAAAFSGRIPTSRRSQGLFVAATVWGVVGYAFGTTIGVSMHRLLQAFV